MTVVERASAQVARWVRIYTAGLDATIAADRREEMLADVHDQIQWARDAGDDDGAIARAIRGRAFRGAGADVAWTVGMALRVPMPAIEHPLRLIVVGLAVALAASAVVFLARRPLTEDPTGALALAVGFAIAIGSLPLLARPRTRAWGALWVVASAQIVLLDGVGYLAATTTVLAQVSVSDAWSESVLLADLGVTLVCVAAAAWWATAPRGLRTP